MKVKCVVTRITAVPAAPTGRRPHDATGEDRTVASAYQRLLAAQKPAARSAPAYSRFVNRRLGRIIAAVAWSVGLTPNAVTAISAALTGTAVVLLVAMPTGWGQGLAVAALLLLGYAFDSADGQVARLGATSSAAGEWLDHMVDATKAAVLPLALAVGLYLNDAVPVAWLLVPIAFSVVSSVLFFAMILTEQLRRQRGRVSLADRSGGSGGWLRALLVLPMDYGVHCLSFLLLGVLPLFLAAYSLIAVASAGFLILAAVAWFRELRAAETNGDTIGAQA